MLRKIKCLFEKEVTPAPRFTCRWPSPCVHFIFLVLDYCSKLLIKIRARFALGNLHRLLSIQESLHSSEWRVPWKANSDFTLPRLACKWGVRPSLRLVVIQRLVKSLGFAHDSSLNIWTLNYGDTNIFIKCTIFFEILVTYLILIKLGFHHPSSHTRPIRRINRPSTPLDILLTLRPISPRTTIRLHPVYYLPSESAHTR